jgi:hypothetical protein
VLAVLVAGAGVLAGSGAPRAQEPAAAATESVALTAQWIERTPPPASGKHPMGSEDASLIYDPVANRVVLYGGKDDANLNLKETWSYDAAERKWGRMPTPGKTPPASEDHTAIYDPDGHRLILFGGENGPTTNKLWSLDLKTFVWKEMTTPQTPRRESHSTIYDSRSKRMVTFGGIDRLVEDIFEIWAFDLNPASPTFEKWQNITVLEGRPPGRIDHAAIYDPVKHRMVLHGGWTKVRQGLFGDTWAFYFADKPGDQGRWERIDTGTTAPPPRRHAMGVHDPDRNLFVLIGGQGRTATPIGDLWAFDLTRDVWTRLAPSGPAPAARIDHQAVYDPRSRTILLYGGDTAMPDAPKLHDVWELTLSTTTPLSSTRGVQ